MSLYCHRDAVPWDLWLTLMNQANESIDLLAYAGLFLWDTSPDVATLLANKARDGTTVRLLIGDPTSEAIQRRGNEEGIGDVMAARIRLTLSYITLYNSIFQFDNDMLVNTHVYAAPAAHSPVIHLRRLPAGRLFTHYLASFEAVWQSATPHRMLPSDG